MLQLNTSLLIQYSLAVPLVSALFAAVIPYRNIRDAFMVITSLFLPFTVYQICDLVLKKMPVIEWRLFEIIPGLAIYFKVEPLGVIFAIILGVLWVVTLLYSIGYMRANNEGRQNSFFAFFCLAIFAAVGLAFSGNLLTLFMFYELITLFTYPLIIHNRSIEAKKAGRLYIAILIGTSLLFFLPAIIFTWQAAGSLDFTNGGILNGKLTSKLTMLLLALYLFGHAKSAFIPLHKWLPAAMVAPTPVSALLHTVVVVKAGVFSFLKIAVYIFGIDNLAKASIETGEYGNWLLYISSFTIITASIIALTKDKLKQLLSYSTISQLSYVLMALSIFTPKGLIAAIFQIITHSFTKITLFFLTGAVYTNYNKKRVSELSGLGRIMPVSFAAFSIAVLSIIGLPPTVGFLFKWNIIDSAMSAEQFLVVGVVAISTMLNAAYFLPIIYKAFFERLPKNLQTKPKAQYSKTTFLMAATTLFTGSMVLALFIWPDIFIKLAEMVGR